MSNIEKVKDIVPYIQYVASAGQTIFVYPFPIFDDGDIAVEQNGTLLTLSTDYTVSGVAAEDGGNITLTSGATAGDIMTIYRDMALERLVDYQQNGDFLANTVNRDYDRLWLAMQQLQGGASNGEGVGRAWRAAPGDSLTAQDLIIADEATRSGRFVGFDSNGKFTYSSPAISSDPSQIYSDVLTMQNDNNPKVGEFVRTVGYTTPGNGGGNDYEIVAAGTGTDDGGSFIDLPGSGLQAKSLNLSSSINVRQFGAVSDAALNVDRYTGTDLGQYLQTVVDYIVANGGEGTVFIPKGEWVIAAVTSNSSFAVELPVSDNAVKISFVGEQGSNIYIDGDESITPSLSGIFGNSAGATAAPNPLVRGVNGSVSFHNLHFEGVLGKQYAADGERFGADLIRFAGLESIEITKCKFKDLTNKATTVFGSNVSIAINNDLENVASDGIRFIGSPNINCSNNKFKYVDDDCIALHSWRDYGAGVPARDIVICHGNQIEDSEGILILGGKNLIITNNILRRTHGTCLAVEYFAGFEGPTSTTNVTICDNIITDPLPRVNAGVFPPAAVTAGAISLSGIITSDASGYPTRKQTGVNSILRPYDIGSGSDYGYTYSPDATSEAAMGGRNILVRGNSVSRTLPAVAAYSDWGYGTYKYRGGDIDPAVTDTSFIGQGIRIVGDVRGLLVQGNSFSGLSLHGIRFEIGSSTVPDKRYFINCLIDSNLFEDTGLEAIDTSWKGGGTLNYTDIAIKNNTFDLDPYQKSAQRNPAFDGTWTVTGARVNIPIGVQNLQTAGMTISGNKFRNCYLPVTSETNGSYYANNEVHCQPVAPQENASNRGVCIPGFGSHNIHIIEDCDPSSATYGQHLNSPVAFANAIPTSGTYVQGYILRRGNITGVGGSPKEWARVTTGSSHVLGTDWIVVNF